jgi:hypothetical protein
MKEIGTLWTETAVTSEEAILVIPWLAEIGFNNGGDLGNFPKPVDCVDGEKRWKIGNLLAWSSPDSDGAAFIDSWDQATVLKLVRTTAPSSGIERALLLLLSKKLISRKCVLEERKLCGLTSE